MTPSLANKLPMEWNASDYFRDLVEFNRFAQSRQFRFFRVSGPEDLQSVILSMQETNNFVAVSDASEGVLSLTPTPSTQRIITVFIAMRHADADDIARRDSIADIRTLFAQLMSALIVQRVALMKSNIFVDPKISISEIDRYAIHGCAAAYFQISYTIHHDLIYDPSQWITTPQPQNDANT